MIKYKTTWSDPGFVLVTGPLNFCAIYCIDTYKAKLAHAPCRVKYCNNFYNCLSGC
jgi:hypothetical protein